MFFHLRLSHVTVVIPFHCLESLSHDAILIITFSMPFYTIASIVTCHPCIPSHSLWSHLHMPVHDLPLVPFSLRLIWWLLPSCNSVVEFHYVYSHGATLGHNVLMYSMVPHGARVFLECSRVIFVQVSWCMVPQWPRVDLQMKCQTADSNQRPFDLKSSM